MKGSSEVIMQLNEVLKGEVTAVNQYFLHASVCKNWGYVRLYKKIYEESLEEMRHAQRLIDRILFLEGMPVLTQPLAVHVGQDLKDLLERDLRLEASALPPLKQGGRALPGAGRCRYAGAPRAPDRRGRGTR